MSMQGFCERERLNLNTFYSWRSKLQTRTALRTDKAAVSKANVSEPAGGFIDLEALESGASRYVIRLDVREAVVRVLWMR